MTGVDLNEYRLARLEEIAPRQDAMIQRLDQAITEIRADIKVHEMRLRWLERFFWIGVAALIANIFKEPLLALLSNVVGS